MAEILRLQTNIPERIALKFATPKIVESQMNGRSDAMYTLTDGRVTYLPLAAQNAIEAAGVRAYQAFEIVKAKVGREIEYQIRLMAESAAVTAPPAAVPQAANNTTNGITHPNHNGGNAQPLTRSVPPPPATSAAAAAASTTSEMMSCFLVALDAIHEAQQYADRNGIRIQFDSTNVTSAALSCFISKCKGGR